MSWSRSNQCVHSSDHFGIFRCHFDWIGGNAAINYILFLHLSMTAMAVTFMRPILIATMRRWPPVRITRAVETWIWSAVSASSPEDHGQVFHSSFLNMSPVPRGSRCVIEGLGKVSSSEFLGDKRSTTEFITCNVCNFLTVNVPPQRRSCKCPICAVNILKFISYISQN
jgi:hypothetical protein